MVGYPKGTYILQDFSFIFCIFCIFFFIYLNQLSTERKSFASRRCPDAGVGAGFRRGATGWLLGGVESC